ncbi:MAG: hypothetical protein ABI456_14780 [Ktedonobacteraceae bacterium]
MTRKDSEKDAERPHYYSQFWLDIAAGRRVIGGPKSDEETELAEPETVEIAAPRRGGRVTTVPDSDGHRDTRTRIQPEVDDEAEAEFEDELDSELEVDEDELTDEVDDQELPNILIDEIDIPDAEVPETAVPEAAVPEATVPEAAVPEATVPEVAAPTDEEAEATDEEDLFEEEEEEEEDDLWPSGRGRKKPKPGRQVKPPKKPKRDTRRSY